jgi:superfamily I DNA and/or RNA helicase
MACKKVKEEKAKLQNDPYLNDVRYIALPSGVRELFQKYLEKNSDGSLTDFLARRKAILNRNQEKGREINGKRVIETTNGGSIQTLIMRNGEID